KAIRPRYVPETGSKEGLAMTTTVTTLAQDIGLARETDYFLMKDQLTEDELGLLYKVRKFAERSEERRVGKECRAGCARDHFQAEDGIRDPLVTGVQTCALPI